MTILRGGGCFAAAGLSLKHVVVPPLSTRDKYGGLHWGTVVRNEHRTLGEKVLTGEKFQCRETGAREARARAGSRLHLRGGAYRQSADRTVCAKSGWVKLA